MKDGNHTGDRISAIDTCEESIERLIDDTSKKTIYESSSDETCVEWVRDWPIQNLALFVCWGLVSYWWL